MKPDWKAAFNVLMDYWDCIPEEDRKTVDQRLKIALNEDYEHTTADEYNLEWLKEYNMGVEMGCNSPLKPLSRKIHTPHQDCIKRALNRLKNQYGFGIPDKSEEWKKDPVILKALRTEFK